MSSQDIELSVHEEEKVEGSVSEPSSQPEEEVLPEKVEGSGDEVETPEEENNNSSEESTHSETHEEESMESKSGQLFKGPPLSLKKNRDSSYRLLGGKRFAIKEDDLFKLNLGFWLRGALNKSEDLEKSSYLINSIIGGIVGLRIHNEIQRMSNWAKRMLNTMHPSNEGLFVIRDSKEEDKTDENRKRSLQAIIDYAAQRKGELQVKGALVIPNVTLNNDIIASAFKPHVIWKGKTPINSSPAGISDKDFWLIMEFITSMLTSLTNKSSYINEFLSDITPHLKGDESNEELVELVYKHSNADHISDCATNHNVITSLLMCSVIKQKGIKSSTIFQNTKIKAASGAYFDIDIIIEYSKDNKCTAHLPITCKERKWNVTDIITRTFINGLIPVKRDKIVEQIRSAISGSK